MSPVLGDPSYYRVELLTYGITVVDKAHVKHAKGITNSTTDSVVIVVSPN
jgi:hypothetical protein